MKDLFERILENKGPLGKWASVAEGYFVFPKLEGPISNRMKFNGKEVITWSSAMPIFQFVSLQKGRVVKHAAQRSTRLQSLPAL